MKPIPSTPMKQHQALIDAFCLDLLAGDLGKAPRAKAVCEISRQMRVAEDGR